MSKQSMRAGMVGLCAIGAAAGASNVARGAIVAGGDGTQNTTAAGTVAQFDNVGSRGSGGSGIYLGPDISHPGQGWVLTAAHVGAGNILFGGNNFTFVSGSNIRLKDPNTNADADLVLYRISTTPALSALTIASSTPSVGTSIVMAGNGRNREATETHYSVSGTTWTEVPSGGDASGYKWAAGNTIRWANNVTENASLVGEPAGATLFVNAGSGPTRVILSDFDNAPNEGQVASGDSGGGMFDSSGNLVGMLDAMGTFESQGQPASTAIFGNITYAADLSYYRAQIVAAMVPEPSSALLLAGACGGAVAMRRRRGRSASV
jgi:hypothetical protein